jgi:hypothetical protein
MTDYPAQHPHVGMCARKETQYFATDLYPKFGRGEAIHGSVARASSALFAGTQGRKRIGEASVWYLYSSVAPREINQFSPEADIIVMLRNPFEALPSLHSQFVFVGIEPVEDFEEALALDEERERAGTRLTSRRALTGRPLAIPSRSSGIWPSLDRNESTSYMRTSDATHWRPTVPQGRVAANRLEYELRAATACTTCRHRIAPAARRRAGA